MCFFALFFASTIFFASFVKPQEVLLNKVLLYGIIFSIVIRIVYVLVLGEKAIDLTDGYYYRAVTLYSGRGFLNGFGSPTALFMPGFTLLLYALFHLVGGPHLYCIPLAQIALGIFSIYTTYCLAKLLVNDTVGLGAALILGFFPSQVIQGTFNLSDLAFQASLWGGLLFWVWGERKSGGAKALCILIASCFFAFSALTRPYGMIIVFAYFLWRLLSSFDRDHVTKGLGAIVSCILLMFLFYSPWIVRNYKVFHRFVPFASCGGVNLWMSNSEGAHGKYTKIPGKYFIAAKSEEEIALDKKLSTEAWHYILNNPGIFIKKIPMKELFFFASDSTLLGDLLYQLRSANIRFNSLLAGLTNGYYFTFLLMAFLFCAANFRRVMQSPVGSFGIVLTATLMLIFAFYEVQTRYHMPMIPAIAIYAASFLFSEGYSRNASEHRHTTSDNVVTTSPI